MRGSVDNLKMENKKRIINYINKHSKRTQITKTLMKINIKRERNTITGRILPDQMK